MSCSVAFLIYDSAMRDAHCNNKSKEIVVNNSAAADEATGDARSISSCISSISCSSVGSISTCSMIQATPKLVSSRVSTPEQYFAETFVEKTKLKNQHAKINIDAPIKRTRRMLATATPKQWRVDVFKAQTKTSSPHLPRKNHSYEREETRVTDLHIADPILGSTHYGRYTGTINKTSTGEAAPSGHGRAVYDNRVYEGIWSNGAFNGFGILTYNSGVYSEGEFVDFVLHGPAFTKFINGRVFNGTYDHGRLGKGKMIYEDGSVYIGPFRDDQRNGQGTYTFRDGSVYKGSFVNDSMHGDGAMRWPNGSSYKGEWVRGEQRDSLEGAEISIF
jgi:hypothetical protein